MCDNEIKEKEQIKDKVIGQVILRGEEVIIKSVNNQKIILTDSNVKLESGKMILNEG